MPYRIVSNPSQKVVVIGESQSFQLEASGGEKELGKISWIEWSCSDNKEEIKKGPVGWSNMNWDNYLWEEKGDYQIVALIKLSGDSKQEKVSLSIRVVRPEEYTTINPTNLLDLALHFRIVADPPLRTVSPEQQMTFRLELTANDQNILKKVNSDSVRWYCINDPSHAALEDRPWHAGASIYGRKGWVWENAKWSFSGHHRVIANIDYEGTRIQVEYPVHVINIQTMAGRAPVFSEAINAPEVIERELKSQIEVIRDIEKRQPPPADKKEAYEKRMKQREEYAVKLRALLDNTRGKERFPIKAQYYSPHNARPGSAQSQWMPLNVFLCEYEAGYWVLVDWTNPANEHTCGVYDGWFGDRYRSPQEAISGWEWHNKYPKGMIVYQWASDPMGLPLRADRGKQSISGIAPFPSERFETDGSLASNIADILGYIAFGATVVAAVATLIVPEPSSKVLSAALWSAIFSSTAAATLNIAERYDNGFSNLRDDTFDVLSIAANLLGAGAFMRAGSTMSAMARGAVVTSRSLTFTKGIIFASFGADAIQGIMIAQSSWDRIKALQDNPNLAPDERLMEIVRVVAQLGATGALLVFNTRATKKDVANLTQQNKFLPPEATSKDILEQLKSPHAEVDLDVKQVRAEGTTAETVHKTTVQTTPGQVGRSAESINIPKNVSDHIKYRDWTTPRKRGIGGAHNSDEFAKAVKEEGAQVISREPHPSIDGVEVVQYKMPALDKAGKLTAQYKNEVFHKTVYDPSKISDEQLIQWGKEAAENASVNGKLRREWVGNTIDGKTIRGYTDSSGNITSFFLE